MTWPLSSLVTERREDLDSESACRSPRQSLVAPPMAKAKGKPCSDFGAEHTTGSRLGRCTSRKRSPAVLGAQGCPSRSDLVAKINGDHQVSGPAPRRRKPETGRLGHARLRSGGRREHRMDLVAWTGVWRSSVLRRVRTDGQTTDTTAPALYVYVNRLLRRAWLTGSSSGTTLALASL